MRNLLLSRKSIDLWLEDCNIWHTKPNIANASEIITRFQVDPREAHYVVVKRISRYLKGTSNYRIWYDRSNDFTLYAYTTIDWVGIIDDRNSTSGGAFFLGGRLVSWISKKHRCTSKIKIEVEYVVVTNNCNQVV